MHGYHAGAVPTVHVGAHTRENESRRTTHLPRPSYLFPGNRPLFPLRLRLCFLPSSYGRLHRPPLQSGRVGIGITKFWRRVFCKKIIHLIAHCPCHKVSQSTIINSVWYLIIEKNVAYLQAIQSASST